MKYRKKTIKNLKISKMLRLFLNVTLKKVCNCLITKYI